MISVSVSRFDAAVEGPFAGILPRAATFAGPPVRVARAAAGLGVRELAERADIAPTPLSRDENRADGLAAPWDEFLIALENAGVIFIEER
ncbi:MAG TPA: hypothetical protein VGA50_17125 [Kiloniellales bacterium]